MLATRQCGRTSSSTSNHALFKSCPAWPDRAVLMTCGPQIQLRHGTAQKGSAKKPKASAALTATSSSLPSSMVHVLRRLVLSQTEQSTSRPAATSASEVRGLFCALRIPGPVRLRNLCLRACLVEGGNHCLASWS